tara:strand:- start:866 stop:1210 length:345 start_codon:yes stop_codon:yes gene_type:complete
MSTKIMFVNSTIISLCFLLLTGCAKYIDIKDGAEKVLLLTKKPANCVSRGTVDVSVLSEIAYVERSEENINRDLLQLAQNSAVSVRANTLVKNKSSKPGEATFSMYKCNRPWAN